VSELNSLPDAVLNVIELLHSQNNRITDQPLFIVQEKKRIYGIDPDWGGDVVWLHDGDELSKEDAEIMEAKFWDGEEVDGNYTRTSFYEYWDFVTACFTENGCNSYIRRNKHNHRGELRVYADGSYRNQEYRDIRNFLMSLRPAIHPQP
jgi:hypothetical protein